MNVRSLGAIVSLVTGVAAQVAGDLPLSQKYDFRERKPRTRLEQIIDRNLASVVKIYGASGLATIRSYSTGVIVSEQGHILTLDLVMLERDKTRVVLADGSIHYAKLFPSHDDLGVRMIQIDPKGRKLVPIAPYAKQDIEHGTFVVSLGNSFRLAEFSEKISATFGVVTARARTGLRYRLSDVDYDGELLITDAANNPGHFGGALFTLTGDWIGMNTRLVESKETNSQLSAAIPTWDLVDYIALCTGQKSAGDETAAEPEAQPVHHGIVLFDRGRRRSPPAYVERTLPGSPGRAVGLEPDDLIVRLDEYSVRTCVEFRNAMKKFRPGQTIDVTFKRGTRVKKVKLTLEKKP